MRSNVYTECPGYEPFFTDISLSRPLYPYTSPHITKYSLLLIVSQSTFEKKRALENLKVSFHQLDNIKTLLTSQKTSKNVGCKVMKKRGKRNV